MMSEDNAWHVSKRISVETVVLMLVQILAVTWFGSKMDSRIERLEDSQVSALVMIERITRLEVTADNLTELVKSQTTAIASIDRKISIDEGGK